MNYRMIDIFEHRLGSHVLKSKGEHPPAPGTLIIAPSVILLVFVEGASVVAKNKKKGICRIIIGGIVSVIKLCFQRMHLC